MFKMSKFLWLFLIGCSIFVFSGCGTGLQKSEDNNADELKSEIISEQLQKEHSELITKANQELAIINQKIRDLNDKIHTKGGKLTETQNKAIDEIEEKRASVNKRMHEIKNVPQEEWDNFKTTFEKDIDEVKTKIDGVLNEL